MIHLVWRRHGHDGSWYPAKEYEYLPPQNPAAKERARITGEHAVEIGMQHIGLSLQDLAKLYPPPNQQKPS